MGTIISGNALDELKKLPDECIDCCITSPPYYGLRDYGTDGQIGLETTVDEYIQKLVVIFREVRRVLKSDGTLWLNIGDSYAGSGKGATAYPENARKYKQGTNKGMVGAIKTTQIKPIGYKRKDLMGIPWELAFALRADGWYLRQDIIWYKPNCMPESVKDRCTKSHEYIFMLSKSETYYYDYEAIKEPCVGKDNSLPRGSKGALTPNSGRRKQDEYKINRYTGFNERYFNKPTPMLRNKRDVWQISTTGYKGAHFATFPEELARNCLLAGCRKGGIVMDPFAGSGTVAVVAVKYDRDYIAIDINESYAEMARERIQKEIGEWKGRKRRVSSMAAITQI